jgi:predicted aspartyl protease
MVSHARRQALTEAGQPIPDPQRILALLDTGASISAVDPSVLLALGLSPTGESEIHTPSTNGTPAKADTYDVSVAILAGRTGDLHFISDTIRVTSSGLAGLGLQALIGTDILNKCIFTYNGSDSCFTLAY